ncbi:MAG: PAS domain-containing sensor histidine kinase, partial [bacterium]
RMDELDRILNVSSNGMRVIGRDGIILKVNRKFCGIMGYSEGELIGEKCSKILTSRCSGPGRTLTRVLDGETVEDEEIETVKKNGEKIICLVNAAALTDPAGGITGVVEEYKDITEKKIYERRLELNKKILSVVNDSVFLHTFSGNILFMNEAAYRQRGYEKHEIFLKGFNGISKGFNDVVVKELKKTGKAVFEDVHYRKDGSKMDVEINSSVVELGGETAVLSAARDFTERKKAREELEKSYEKLKELDDLKTSFTQMITHELRTPITSIKGYVSFILGGASGGINEKTREFLEIVKNNSERLLRLINDLLDAAKIESGAFMLEKETMSVEKVIDDVIKTLEGAARGKNIKFIKTGDFKDAEIYADEYRINQIILNFASNALKFSPEGAVIHIGFEKNFDVLRSAAACKNRLAPGKYARLYVKDEGKGIEKEDVENIFERFAQAGKGADRKKGTGLGLSIARSIARAHNGETWVESRGRGKGSVFNAAIPLKASLREGEK